MQKILFALLVVAALAACSGPEDVLENIADVSVPDQLTGCVSRNDEGVCQKAACVADDENDCEDWAKACEKHEHIADVKEGHNTCERREAGSGS